MPLALRHIFEHFTDHPEVLERPWLILGKGPSFASRGNYDLSQYKVLSLNDSLRECEAVAIAHFVDFDAYERCADTLSERLDILVVLPWFPHFNHEAGRTDLLTLAARHVALAKLAAEGRLYWYDLSSSPVRRGDYPVISAYYFSSEAAFDLLATAGVRQVRSLGVDGGTTYSAEFSDLTSVSLLANGHRSFDRQFESFATVIARTGVDYAPLDMETPIRVCVASSASEALPVKVLEYSIKKHASSTVVVVPLCDAGISIPKPIAPENRARTPFSFQRFIIPEVCGFAGRAIYLDSDMLVFRDIVDLWRRPFGTANVLSAYSSTSSGRKPQYSVMVMDCSRLEWSIQDIVGALDAGELSYEQLMYDFSLAHANAVIEPDWNALETYKAGQTALLHYTDMNTQPWVSHLNALGYLWVRTLRQALQEGAISRGFVEDEVAKGHVRPSLLHQLDYGIDDAILLPKSIIAADAQFTAPYRTLESHQASPWRSRLLWLRASVRARYQSTSLYRIERRIGRWLAASLGR
ncbi:hypothetical protein J5J83_07790 [Azoarcus sp. L1K30]|uniref:hypothetical protein n=1 Tax=Azoarcus sp. L1K30 TaxID=2820277 RepID=UPI001B81D3B1|nr:hypothetical protein [Azoarcus sp. L1K30]MBR0566013.1 hypothetical protein [Azoarcus sp. L1K30]